jgi:diphosphate-dependent phosphofructokinase
MLLYYKHVVPYHAMQCNTTECTSGVEYGVQYLMVEHRSTVHNTYTICTHTTFNNSSLIGTTNILIIVQLTNIKDCIARGFCQEHETPIEVAARQLIKDGISVLHTIGGDDTNTQAAQLSKYILEHHLGGKVVVIGMPKTIDNDIYPIVQSFGAQTAADQGALFFDNVVSESTSNPKMLILHECMGRDSGYLTSRTAKSYRDLLAKHRFVKGGFTTSAASRDIHAIVIPELHFDLDKHSARLKTIMDQHGTLNVFFGEGTGVEEVIENMEANGEHVPRDAFGHEALAKINPGQYFATRLAILVGAEKTLVQNSGYFARSAAANDFDRELIGACAKQGVEEALAGVSGCMGQDEDMEGTPIRAIEFERIKGGKPFDIRVEWFQTMLKEIGQECGQV